MLTVYVHGTNTVSRASRERGGRKLFARAKLMMWRKSEEKMMTLFLSLKHFCSLCSFSTVAVVEVHQRCDTPCFFRFMMHLLHIPFPFPVPCRTVIVFCFSQLRVFYTAGCLAHCQVLLQNTKCIHCESPSQCFKPKTI